MTVVINYLSEGPVTGCQISSLKLGKQNHQCSPEELLDSVSCDYIDGRGYMRSESLKPPREDDVQVSDHKNTLFRFLLQETLSK